MSGKIERAPLSAVAMLAAPLLAAAGLSACAQQPPREAKPMVAVGEPVSCVPLNRIRETRVIDDQTIDFRLVNNEIYRNTLPNKCPGLNIDRSFSYKTSQTQLCNVDIITVLHTGAAGYRGASCGLGQFVPVKPADDAGDKAS